MNTTAKQREWATVNGAVPKQAQKKVFFPNLDGLRTICFLMVFLFHAYMAVFSNLAPDSAFYRAAAFLFQNGELGVNFFFVLSGFLITFLLVKEKERTGTVHLKHFYYRRILRIWPLFYVCVIIGFVATPLLKSLAGQPSTEDANLWYYLFFINNFDFIRQWPSFPDALILCVLWSVAVEEQFYLVWPVLLKYTSRRKLPLLFCGIILCTFVFRSFFLSDHPQHFAVRQFHTLAVVGDMAWGALLAYYCSYNSALLRLIKALTRPQIIAVYTGAAACIFFRDELFSSNTGKVLERFVIAFFFGAIIVEQNFARRSFFKSGSFTAISRLGIYTYGFYCLHFFVISVVHTAAQKFLPAHNEATVMAITLVALAATITAGRMSYHFLEQPFLRLKDKFAYIKK